MSFDFYCQIVSEYSDKVEKLAKLENNLREANEQENRNEAKEIQKEINSIYEEFYKKHPTLFYQYLEGKSADDFRNYWLKKKRKKMPDENFGVKIGVFESTIIPKIDPNYLSPLPGYSFVVQFKFTLAKSYVSKDDQEFYIVDNPVKKDWVFKVPMVSPITWKGHLRWTMRKNKGPVDEPFRDDDEQIIKLFGHQKEREEDKERRGRLMFFPTFLDKIDIEVINPHDRRTKAGTLPIPIEVAPEDAKGTFTLLYVPFDLIGKREGDVKKEVAQDIETICEAVKEMMTTYGFSAKKTSGFGVIKESIQGYFLPGTGFPVIEIESEQPKEGDSERQPKQYPLTQIADIELIARKLAEALEKEGK